MTPSPAGRDQAVADSPDGPDERVVGVAEPRACRRRPAVRFAASRRAVTLHYRHVNQAEPWRCTDMMWRDGEYRSHIPGEYTGTLYPIMYYFEFYDGDVSGFYPGIAEDLSNCPYFSLTGNGAQSLL